MPENRGLQALNDRVIQKDLCTLCGACLSLCPYLRSWQGRIVKLDECDLSEGRCFAYCPRTEVDPDALHERIFGQGYGEIQLGMVRRVVMARSREAGILKAAQSGGVVSSLLAFALKEKRIDAAVLTGRDGNHLPHPQVASHRKEVLACAGSRYVAGPTLEALNRGPWKETDRIGVVGIPCQVLALAKMKASPLERRTAIDRVCLVIGLFCTWALTYAPFMAFLRERVGGSTIQKLDITPPPERLLKAYVGNEVWEFPLDEIRPYIRPTCGVCTDMTSEFSDLSVGTVEGLEGWNTVIVRTERGEELLERAEARHAIETRPLPPANLDHLREASLLKKRRALVALRERGEREGGYLMLKPERIRQILSDGSEEIGT